MEILPVQGANNQTFTGKVIYKNAKKMPEKIYETLQNSSYIKEMSESNDVIIRYYTNTGFWKTITNSANKNECNLSFAILNENSKLDRIKDFLGKIPRIFFSGDYHEEKKILARLNSPTKMNSLMARCNFLI